MDLEELLETIRARAAALGADVEPEHLRDLRAAIEKAAANARSLYVLFGQWDRGALVAVYALCEQYAAGADETERRTLH